jgi:hypothetical protein
MGTPLYDTVGSGLSLLDTVLHARVNAHGIVEKTLTRMLIVGKIGSGRSVDANFDLRVAHSSSLGDSSDTTGLLVMQANSFFNLIETPVEMAIELLRTLTAAARRGNSSFNSLRVVACVEDCPNRYFGPWSLREVSVPSEAPVILEDVSTIQLAVDLMASLTSIGQQLLDLGGHSVGEGGRGGGGGGGGKIYLEE